MGVMPVSPGRYNVVGLTVDADNVDGIATKVVTWGKEQRSAYVCVANVHMTMEGHDDPVFQTLVNGADLVVSDGMPLVWMLRAQGCSSKKRVAGVDLTLAVCEAAAREGVSIACVGGKQEVLEAFGKALQTQFPALQVAMLESPPFRPTTAEEDQELIDRLNASGAGIVFVGLGCPKQERWMAARRGRLNAVMLGVGAAFDVLSGARPPAPQWMQDAGLEWLFRLMCEPRRLWKRYWKHNPRFVGLALMQLAGLWTSRTAR